MCSGPPQDHTPYLQHEPIPGLGHAGVFPLIIIGWGAVVLIPHQHLLQEEVGCELQGLGKTQEGASAHLLPRKATSSAEPVVEDTEHPLGERLNSGTEHSWLGLLWVSIEEETTT